MLSIFVLALPLLVHCNPIELQPRAGCNADNCLRALEHTSSLASPFCSTYYTKYFTPSFLLNPIFIIFKPFLTPSSRHTELQLP